MAKIKIARFFSASASNIPAPKLVDSLDVFGTETAAKPASQSHDVRASRGDSNRSRRYMIIGAIAGVLVATGAATYWRLDRFVLGAAASQASLTIETTPIGAEVLIDGAPRGKTPLTLAFAAGEQNVEVVQGGQRKTLRVPLAAGATVVHHITFEAQPAVPPAVATLQVTTEPSRLRVTVDGVARGVSPLSLAGLTAGPHTVQVAHPAGVLTRSVELRAGEATTLLLSGVVPPADGAAGGWLAVTSAEPLQLIEKDEVIGTTQTPRLMLPAGRHDIEFVSEALGFRDRRTVQISAGGTAAVRVELPRAPLSVNAQPWADVSIDGTRLGETPIGNHPVAIGRHELIFRHPQFGERRQTVTVTLKGPARVSVDMRKQ